MSRLEGKTAVVTGASSGIGAAIARVFAVAGAHVVINYNHSEDKAAAVLEQIQQAGGKALVIKADISDPVEVNSLIKEAQGALGQIDIWINNAGADILTGEGAERSTAEKLDALIAVDLKGTIQCCWGIVPLMQRAGQGNIINMTWDIALRGGMAGLLGDDPQMFAAVKAGVSGFSQFLARSVAPQIRVNLLAPGWITTAFAEDVMESSYYQERLRDIPLQRFGQPEDVAYTALYLASDEATYITGQTINVNGGLI